MEATEAYLQLKQRAGLLLTRLFENGRLSKPLVVEELDQLVKEALAYRKNFQNSETPEIQDSLEKSHIHGNGFVKLHLLDTYDGRFRLRAHLWQRTMHDFVDLNVHNHRYDFLSLVGHGSMVNVVWKPDPAGEAFRTFEYHPRASHGAYRLIETGSEPLLIERIEKLKAGDVYFLGREELHYSRPGPEPLSVTFFSRTAKS